MMRASILAAMIFLGGCDKWSFDNCMDTVGHVVKTDCHDVVKNYVGESTSHRECHKTCIFPDPPAEKTEEK